MVEVVDTTKGTQIIINFKQATKKAGNMHIHALAWVGGGYAKSQTRKLLKHVRK
jgi:hypothetical protein